MADKKYGQTFNLQDELPGLAGFRSIQSDPERSLQYMTTRFGSKLKKDDNLFIAPLLKGGRVSPQDIINSYNAFVNTMNLEVSQKDDKIILN